MGERIILHCDCNGFYASCECVLWPAFPRAHGSGGRSGKPAWDYSRQKRAGQAQRRADGGNHLAGKKKMPATCLVPPQHGIYREFSRRINAIYGQYTDLVEPFSIDESFLDVTGSLHLFAASGRELADRCAAGCGGNRAYNLGGFLCKLFAKMGSDYKKPDATTIITRENYRNILYPLPVGALLYVGQAAAEKLGRLGVRTIGDFASAAGMPYRGCWGRRARRLSGIRRMGWMIARLFPLIGAHLQNPLAEG